MNDTTNSNSEATTAAATPSLIDLREAIKNGLNSKSSSPATVVTDGTESAEQLAEQQKKLLELRSRAEYRFLRHGTDGLYVALANLIYGRFAKLTKTDEPGVFIDLLTLPFLPEGQASAAAQRVTVVGNKLIADFRDALPAKGYKQIRDIASLMCDIAADFSSMLPNATVAREIIEELNRKNAQFCNALHTNWAFSCFSVLQDSLFNAMSDIRNDAIDTQISAVCKNVTSAYVKLQLAVSGIDQADMVPADLSYDASAIFNSVNFLKSASAVSPAKSTQAEPETLDVLASRQDSVFRTKMLEINWLDVPFVPVTDAQNVRKEIARTLVSFQHEASKLLRNQTREEAEAGVAYGKRLASLHDRMSTLVARFGGCLATYGANTAEKRVYSDLAKKLMIKARAVSMSPLSQNKKIVGALLHELRAEIMGVLEHIADSNIEPANLRELRDSAAAAVVSYYVDMHGVMMDFFDGLPIRETNKHSPRAFGYISWLKGLYEKERSPMGGLFSSHTPESDDELILGEDHDDLSAIHPVTIRDREILEVAKKDRPLALFLEEWGDQYDSLQEAKEEWDDNDFLHSEYAKRVEILDAQGSDLFAKKVEDLMQRAASTNTKSEDIEEGVEDDKTKGTTEVPSKSATTVTEAKPCTDAREIMARYTGDTKVLMEHHKNAPLYYSTLWGAYWEEYEANLKKAGYAKKVARATRREEEDVVGILQFERVNKYLPYNMFFRSYLNKGTTSTTAVVVKPKDEDFKHYYFAYGSNVDEAQVEKRTPYAKLVGRVVLKNYKLTFTTYNYAWKGGVANVEPSEGDVVYGVLWHFTDDMLKAMDKYEGHPHTYTRHECTVSQVAAGDLVGLPQDIAAVVYEIQNATKVHDFQPASEKYYNQIKAGYDKFQLPVVLLEEAQKFSTDNKVERKTYSSGSYYWDDDDYYSGRYYDRTRTYTPSGTSSSTSATSRAGYSDVDWDQSPTSRASALRDEAASSLFSSERWYLDMTKSWWESNEI